MKHHTEPCDKARPLADLTQRLPPPFSIPENPLPEAARSDELTTDKVPGTVYRSTYRQQWLRQRIQSNCIAGENPVLHVTHAPHMLEPLDHDEASVSAPPSHDTTMDERMVEDGVGLLGRVLGRKTKKRRLEVVVEIPLRSRSKLAIDHGNVEQMSSIES